MRREINISNDQHGKCTTTKTMELKLQRHNVTTIPSIYIITPVLTIMVKSKEW